MLKCPHRLTKRRRITDPAPLSLLYVELEALDFISEAYKHFKTLAGTGEGVDLLAAAGIPVEKPNQNKDDENQPSPDAGLVLGRRGRVGSTAAEFIAAIAQHRQWNRKLIATRFRPHV